MRFKAKKTKMRASKTEGSSDSESEQTVSNDPPSQPPGLMPGAFNLFGSGIPPQTGASPQPNTSNTMQNLLFDPSEIYKSIGLANKTAQEMEQAKKLQESRFNNQCGNTWNYRIGNAIPSVTSDTEESTVDTDAASIMTPNLDFRRQSRRRKGFIFPTNPFHESLDMSEHKSRSSNHLRPTSDPTVIYKEKIDNDKTVNDLITVCEMFGKAFVDNQSMSETDKKAMTSYLSQINNLKVRKMVEIQEREKIYENSQRLKTIRKEQVIVPENCPDYPSSLPFNEIHNFIGKMNDHLPQSMKDYFAKLFTWGTDPSNMYSHDNYKLILMGSMQGRMHQEFLKMQHRPLQEIVNWFMRVYNKKTTFMDCQNKLKHFLRKAGEDIYSFMDRYWLEAVSADQYLPRNEMYFTTDLHCMQVLEHAIQEPAFSQYAIWRDEQLEEGFQFDVELCQKEAYSLERKLKCLPKADVMVPTVALNVREPAGMQINQVEVQKPPKAEANPAVAGRGRGKNPNPYKKGRTENDPNKSSSPRASFFNNNKDPLKAELSKPLKSGGGKGGKKKPWQKGGKGGNKNRHDFSKNNPSKKPEYSQPHPNQTRGKWDNTDSEMKDLSKTSQKPRYNKNNFSSYPRGKPIKQGWFCKKCGVMEDIEQSKKMGCDHITDHCPNYKNVNPNYCSFCATKGIKANHWVRDCLNVQRREIHAVENKTQSAQ